MRITRILNFLLKKTPCKNILVYESIPHYACNTYPVFLELKRRLPHYKMVWFVQKDTKIDRGADVVCEYDCTDFVGRVRQWYYSFFAKGFISSNAVLTKRREQQVSLFLCHGSKTKKTRGSYEVGEGVDYVNVQSHFFDDIITYEYNCRKDNLVYLGYPRCDWLYDNQAEVCRNIEKLKLPEAAQYVVWLPTYRKHKNGVAEKQMTPERYDAIGMPLVYTREELSKLNDCLVQLGMCILFKPHPAQDISSLKAADLSHIRIISDQYLEEQGLQLYQVLAGSSGLITDYSSVFFDYLLLDRPIATTTDDIDAWKAMTGFAFDLDAVYDRATTRCPDLTALLGFLSAIRSGPDDKASGRAEIREQTNMWLDGNSAKRVADFIMEKIGE